MGTSGAASAASTTVSPSRNIPAKPSIRYELDWQAVSMRLIAASPTIDLLFMKPLNNIEVADALVLDDTTDGLGEGVGNGQLLDLGATLCVGDRVGEHNLLEG